MPRASLNKLGNKPARKKKPVVSPHDTFFRNTIAEPPRLREFLRLYLPPALVELLDLDAIERVDTSFVDAELREHYSDLFLRVGLKAGGEAFVFFLLEHKSAPEERVPLQLLRYLTQAWEQMPLPLPLIVPVVIYHGAKPWPFGRSFRDLFGPLAQQWRRFLPDFEIYLCDLSQYADRELKGEAGLAPILKLLKYSFRPELPRKLPGVFRQTADDLPEPAAEKLARTMTKYLTNAGRVTEAQIGKALEQGGKMETIIDKWEKEWRQEAREEVIPLAADFALRLVRLQFGPLERATETKIRRLSFPALKRLNKVMANLKSLAELESWLQEQSAHEASALARKRARV